MKPGERIRLIKECADSLVTRTFGDAQLTLDQFGFDTWDPDFGGNDHWEYFLGQVKAGNDDSIAQLHEYVLGEDAAPFVSTTIEGPWGALPARVFLSHIHGTRHFVGDVKRRLAEYYGIDAFVAHDDIHPSKQWREVIKTGLATCHAFVAFLDDGFHASQWCDQEAGWAVSRRIPILPVRPVGFDRSGARDGFLEEHQDICIDRATGNLDFWVADQIFQSMLNHSRTREVGVKALAEAFVTSWSFDAARRFWALLAAQPVIESEQLRRLEYAVQTNRQVYEAVAPPDGTLIPDLVKALVAKMEPPPVNDPWGSEPPF